MGDRLDQYRQKRDFDVTPEPAPADIAESPGNRFVVQEHHARRLHWDFRLEHDGVLASWAIPKGVPADPAVNHLAVQTEDHPLSYVDFEGEIPKGNYGAGVVTVWDSGTYECEKFRPGEVMVVLHGQRVEGRYVLFQTDGDQWMIHRMDPPQDPTREPMPDWLPPMEATPGDLPDDDAEFGFEVEWDGLRALVFGEGGRVRVRNAAGDDMGDRFPELARLGRALGSHEVILDGELVALGEDGQPDRERLDRRLAGAPADKNPLTFMAYDLLYLDGHRTVDRPYTDRRAALGRLELSGFHWQTPAYHAGDGAGFLEVVTDRGLRGVVAKRLSAPYGPGETSPDWVAVRARR